MIGTTLFLDDSFIASGNFVRSWQPGRRTRQLPVLDNKKHKVANFAHTVIKEPGGPWRIWYMAAEPLTNSTRYTAHSYSSNGITWAAPTMIPGSLGREFVGIVDTGRPGPTRFLGYRKDNSLPPQWSAELMTSPDGINWTGGVRATEREYGEVWAPYRANDWIGMNHRWNIRDLTWFDAEGVFHRNTKHDNFVRCIGHTRSFTPGWFPESTILFSPGNRDSGETQFYGTSTVFEAGQYLAAFLLRLRDDLQAEDVPPASYGIGDSELIFSPDKGVTWQRTYRPYLLPHTNPSHWDHAVAWINGVRVNQGTTNIYYGGYQYGHKNVIDRQIGLLQIKTDRYAAISGEWSTPFFDNVARKMFVNLEGSVTVAAVNAAGQTLGTASVAGNTVSKAVPLNLSAWRRPIRFVFKAEGVGLYGFRLQ